MFVFGSNWAFNWTGKRIVFMWVELVDELWFESWCSPLCCRVNWSSDVNVMLVVSYCGLLFPFAWLFPLLLPFAFVFTLLVSVVTLVFTVLTELFASEVSFWWTIRWASFGTGVNWMLVKTVPVGLRKQNKIINHSKRR